MMRWPGEIASSMLARLTLLMVLVPALYSPVLLGQQSAVPDLRVGVYHNPPKILPGDDGRATGIFGDLLHAIAEREGWNLESVACEWNQCLDLLEAGQIDLMPDVALNAERAERFAFHQIPALLSWSQVYTRPELGIASLLDLEARRLAVLSASVQETYLRDLSSSLQVSFDWVPVSSLEEGFMAVVSGQADAVVSNQFFGDLRASELELRAAPVVFQPSRLFIAASADMPELFETIDTHLATWQNDPDSVYFDILARWSGPASSAFVPLYVWWTLAILLAGLLLGSAFILALHRQVDARTRELRDSEERLSTILESVEAFIYIKGRTCEALSSTEC